MAALIISEEQKILPLEEYFPPSIEIHDYNPSENKTIKKYFLDGDIKNWLRQKSNKNFVFQCLLCRQEMTFSTVFLRGNYHLNRSHLLTKKHIAKVKNVVCVGVLFVSSQKFILCNESVFRNGKLFDSMKTVTRRKNELVISNQIKNKIFCSKYSMYTFDNKSKSLCEMDTKCDIVEFMINCVRPLFNFHCLLCDIKSGNFSQVVDHLGGKRHTKKLKGSKGVIISIRDFNVFIACKLDELSSFLFLEHLNSYLEEIVIASAGTIIISGSHSTEGKQAPKDGEITIDVKPIELPNGVIAQKSIKVTTRYNNFLTDTSENEISDRKLAAADSRINKQQNVTIYEYSLQDFKEHCMDNILHALFTIGCKIWCSRCKKGIFTLQALQTHLSSLEHTKNMRSNEQIGFMCHVCKIFFIELKGESLVHTHSSHQNKSIIKQLSEGGGTKSLEYNTPLNKSIIDAYGGFMDSIREACKFCCIACKDVAKPKLMYLGYHEISPCHKNLTGALVYAFCEYCNVIYIESKLHHMRQFKLHFAKHINDNKGPITYHVNETHNNNTTCFSSNVSNNFFSIRDVILQGKNESFNCKKLTISFSQNFTQFDNPGVCSIEFAKSEQWNNVDFSKYLQLYSSFTGKEIEYFECYFCHVKNAMKMEQILRHLFISEHQTNLLYKKEIFLKICDICNLVMLSENKRGLQQHFCHYSHLDALSKVMGLPYSAAHTSLSLFMNMSRSSLIEEIKRITCEMKENYKNRQKYFETLTKDILALMSNKFNGLSVTFYGSRLSGLATNLSDFDIFLNIGNNYLDHVKELLNAENDLFKFIVCLSDCAVPVIQAKHKNTGFRCEFNLNYLGQHDRVLTSRIIKILTDLDERVLWLLAAVKHWAIATNMKSTNMFSSHAITWLVLFYLMQPDLRIIPNISFVIDQCGDLDKDCTLEWNPKINKDKTWLELLEGFFNYYSLMKFSKYKLFPFSGLVVPVMPGEPDHLMFMEDPFIKERNIFLNATKEKVEKLTSSCYQSLHLPWRLND